MGNRASSSKRKAKKGGQDMNGDEGQQHQQRSDHQNDDKNTQDYQANPALKSKFAGFDPSLISKCDCAGARFYDKAT